MRLIWTRRALAGAILITTIFGGVPAYAHTAEELDEWTEGWDRRIADTGFDVYRLDEWVDMAGRHPRFFGRHVHTPLVRQRSSQGSSVAGVSAGVEQWRSLVAQWFRPEDVDRALRIMACESGGNPNAKNPGSSASGLFQHLGKYWTARSAAAGFTGASIFDPTANVATAAWLRDQRGGWLHWVCR